MPDSRRTVLKNLLLKSNLESSKEYIYNLENVTIYEQESLLWAIDVEPSVKATQFKTNRILIIYNNITEHPFGVYQKIFKHFSLDLGPESWRFIEETTQEKLTNNNSS